MQDIYAEDEGSGFPLVLVHGFLGIILELLHLICQVLEKAKK